MSELLTWAEALYPILNDSTGDMSVLIHIHNEGYIYIFGAQITAMTKSVFKTCEPDLRRACDISLSAQHFASIIAGDFDPRGLYLAEHIELKGDPDMAYRLAQAILDHNLNQAGKKQTPKKNQA